MSHTVDLDLHTRDRSRELAGSELTHGLLELAKDLGTLEVGAVVTDRVGKRLSRDVRVLESNLVHLRS